MAGSRARVNRSIYGWVKGIVMKALSLCCLILVLLASGVSNHQTACVGRFIDLYLGQHID
jgi:hypothetical protein